jgi:hypothetical protein
MAAAEKAKLGDVVEVTGGGMVTGAEGATTFRILEDFAVKAAPDHVLAVAEGPHVGSAVRPVVFVDLAQCVKVSG